jgi:hypothetical protein
VGGAQAEAEEEGKQDAHLWGEWSRGRGKGELVRIFNLSGMAQ